MDWYRVSLDTQHTLKFLINRNPKVVPLNSILVSKELREANELLEIAKSELNNLTMVYLVSIFEQPLISYLTGRTNKTNIFLPKLGRPR